MNYPTPQDNPVCQCKDNPARAFFCGTGHMLECHYPYTCTQAACSHLRKYDFSETDVRDLEALAKVKLENGELAPYILEDQHTMGVRLDQVASDDDEQAPL